jgi:outer membrane receptor for ferrienterochelin and colicins
MMSRFSRAAALLVLLWPLSAPAQHATVTWSGRISDSGTLRSIERVSIRAFGPDTIMTQTNANGRFELRLRPDTDYTVELRSVGFAPRRERVAVTTGTNDIVHELRLDRVAFSLDQVVVTAARREQRLADAVPSIEVIGRADIERSGSSDLASVLTEQSGIVLQGGHPAGAGAMLQGIGSERVLVLLDGQPMTGRLSGVFDISRIPVSVVERVEVMKGPQSTLYGTEAMGGVINIITRRPSTTHDWDASIVTTAGTQARRDLSGALSHARNGLSAALNVGHRSTDMTPGRESPDGALAARTDLALSLRAELDSTRSIDASVLLLDERQRWRTGTFYNFGDNRQYSGRVRGSWQTGNHRFTPTISTSQYNHVSRASLLSQPIAGDTGQRQVQRVYQAELLYNARFGANGLQALDIGTQVRRDETQTARVTGGARSLTVLEPFVQMELAIGSLALAPGVRVSSSDLWGENVTTRLASRWRVNEQLTVRASAGEGFRAPDFKELFMFFQNTSAGYAVYGNPDLQPETSRNITLGTEWVGNRQFARAQFFINRFRDFIETRPITQPGEAPVFAYGNVDRGYTRGLELETGISMRGIRAEASYSGLSTRDDATGMPLLGRPAHSVRTTLNTLLPLTVRLSATGLYTGRMPMTRDDSTGLISSYRDAFARLDLRIARTLTWAGQPIARGLELVIGVDNAFDRRPAEWAGFTGRQLYTTLSWNLQPTFRP